MASKRSADRDSFKKSRSGYQGSFTKLIRSTTDAAHYVNAVRDDFDNNIQFLQTLKDGMDATAKAFDKLVLANQNVLDCWQPDPKDPNALNP